jgi:hypothetical protein
MIRFFTPSSVFTCLSLISASAAAATVSPIRYQGERLSARIDNQPLNTVLRELGAATGARFVLNDPENGQSPVSAAVESQPFVDGVKRILEGFSYAIYPMEDADLPTVIVLSTPRVSRSIGVSGSVRPLPASEQKAEDSSTGEQAEAMTRAEHEETLNRATAALSQEGQLNQQVLNQLEGIGDPRATQMLVQAASGVQNGRDRVRATEALWHHAADLQFADEASISALEQLATDTDARVQKTAQQALEDMRQYRQRNSSP